MLPREHGAYGQLLFPLVTALAIGRPALSASMLACAIVCAFLSHEPLLVLLGQRGARAAREQRAQATRWFASCASGAVVLGGAGIALMPSHARTMLVVPAILAAALVVVVVRGREHTAAGEVLSAVTLSSFALPVGAAAGAGSTAAAHVRRRVRRGLRRGHRLRARGHQDRKSTRLNSSHIQKSRMPSSA